MTRVRASSLTIGLIVLASVAASTDSRTAPVMLQFGDLLFAEGRYSQARLAYESARDTDDAVVRRGAMTGVVRAALRVGAFEAAMTTATDLRASAPGDDAAQALYADALWASGLFEDAEVVYADVVARAPALPEAHHGMARALAATNRLDEALSHVRTALELAPRNDEFHHTAGSILERMRRYDEAVTEFGAYLSLLPNQEQGEQAILARSKLRFLRSFGERPPIDIKGDPAALHRIPFKMSDEKIIVRGRINDRRNVDFVLDTGAEHTVLSARTSEAARVEPIVRTLAAGVGEVGLRGLLLGKIDQLSLGTLTVEHLPTLIKDPRLTGFGLPKNERDGFSPIALGLSMSIDYERREVIIGRDIAPEPAHTVLPLRQHRLAMVQGVVNDDRRVTFIVDTGGEVISISRATAMSLGPPTFRRIPLKVFGASGWDPDAFLLPGVDLRFNQIEYNNFSVVVLNLDAPSTLLGFQVGGIVGHKFLSRYRVAIDLLRSEVRLSS